jgi:DNA-binding transcriptional LysR family regulator
MRVAPEAPMLDWNDVRFFLAVARSGSTLAASKQLKVSQATVFRRIAVFEEALGAKLFVRRPSGYGLSVRGRSLLPAAEAVEVAVRAFEDEAAAELRRLSGQVRLTTVESAANAWVIPALAALRQNHPGVRVEIITGDDNLDLLHGEADVAIRFGPRPSEEVLIARHLTDIHMCLYASHDLVTRLGRPVDYADIARYPLIEGTMDHRGPMGRWIAAHVPDAEIGHKFSALSGIIGAVRAGLGAALIPCMMGDALHGLVRLMPPIPELTLPCWMVSTDHARRQPHIRAVIDHVVDHILAQVEGPVAGERVSAG